MYSKQIHVLLATCLILILTACKEEMSPPIAGSVSYRLQGGVWAEKSLSEDQLKNISNFLQQSGSNWHRCFSSLPGGPLLINLKHTNGTSSSIQQLHFSNSDTTLMASNLSGSNLSDQPCALQSFSKEEIHSLYQLLDIPQ